MTTRLPTPPMQMAVVTLASVVMSYTTDRYGYRSPFNLIWMVGLPTAMAFAANKDAGSRALMGLVLVIWTPLASIATLAILGGGY